MVARIWLAPVREHPLEAALGEVRLHHAFGHVGEAVPGERGVEHLGGAVEGHLAFDAHLEFAAAFFKFPRVQAAMRRQPKIDAVVADQLLRFFGSDRLRKYEGAPTTAMRMSGPTRTAIMSFATCSPLRTPAS